MYPAPPPTLKPHGANSRRAISTTTTNTSSSSSGAASSASTSSSGSSPSSTLESNNSSSHRKKREVVRKKNSYEGDNGPLKRSGTLQSSSSSESLGSYEYCGRLVVVKRKPPILFETDRFSRYGDYSHYISNGSSILSRSRSHSFSAPSYGRHSKVCGNGAYYDTGDIEDYCSTSRSGVIRNYNDYEGDVRLLGHRDKPIRGELVYDSGYYRVTDPEYRSPRLNDILEVKESKWSSQRATSRYLSDDYDEGPGYFERELSRSLRSSFAC
ncbi:hypothetical protein ACOME3_009129 [Neoechinorhynchus agilis]